MVSRKVLPHIRAELGKILLKKYGWSQMRVAKVLGVSQASVSHYVTSSRGGDEELSRLFPEISDYTLELARKLVDGKVELEVHPGSDVLCHVCKHIINDERFQKYMSALACKV